MPLGGYPRCHILLGSCCSVQQSCATLVESGGWRSMGAKVTWQSAFWTMQLLIHLHPMEHPRQTGRQMPLYSLKYCLRRIGAMVKLADSRNL
mmetsp:Transcript_183176/g.445964  ORF Transcript_183176/g.445964 Transcript_183176/m.445964 type:complete len:92 (-) Transcript_183176:373-648(-)